MPPMRDAPSNTSLPRRIARATARILGFLIAMFLLFIAGAGLIVSYNVHARVMHVDSQSSPFSTEPAELTNVPDDMNGPVLVIGLYALGLAAIVLNNSLRARSSRGPMDWVFAHPILVVAILFIFIGTLFFRPLSTAEVSNHWSNGTLILYSALWLPIAAIGVYLFVRRRIYEVLPLSLALTCVTLSTLMGTTDLSIHLGANEAVNAFNEFKVRTVRTSGQLVFGHGSDGVCHVAVVSPRFHRAVVARGLDLTFSHPRPFPVPGVLPLVVAAAIAAYSFHGRRSPSAGPRAALFFGLLTLYMAWWFSDVVRVPMWLDGTMQPAYYVQHILLAICGILFTLFGSRKIGTLQLEPRVRAGWSTIYFSIQLLLIAGLYLVYYQIPGSPALFWMLAYITLGALTWLGVTPLPPEENS